MALASSMNAGLRFTFRDANEIDRIAGEVLKEWFVGGKMNEVIEADLKAFEPYSAESMTRRITECFAAAINSHKP